MTHITRLVQQEVPPGCRANGTEGDKCQLWPCSLSGIPVMGTGRNPTGELFLSLISPLVP